MGHTPRVPEGEGHGGAGVSETAAGKSLKLRRDPKLWNKLPKLHLGGI